MNAFEPHGPILSFTAAGSAPTSVKAISLDDCQNQQFCLTNIDPSNDCVVGWGQTDVEAKINAAAGATVSKCYYLLHGTQVVITASNNAFFSGISSGTAIVKVQAGMDN